MIHRMKGFSIVNETEMDAFLKFSCFLYNPVNVGSLISSSSSFSKPSLDIWKFLVCIMLKHTVLYVVLSCSVVFNSLWPPWTVAHQAPLSMGSCRQEYWSGFPCPPPGESSWPRDGTPVSRAGRRVLYHERHVGRPYFVTSKKRKI